MSDLDPYYRLLGLAPGASAQAVKQAYRALVKQWHPDRVVHDEMRRQQAEERLKAINDAYRRLKAQPGWDEPERAADTDRPAPTAGAAAKPAPNSAANRTARTTVYAREATSKTFYDRAVEAVDEGDYEAALDFLRAAIRLNPEDAAAYKFRGFVYSVLGLELSAETDLAKAQQLEFEQQVVTVPGRSPASPPSPTPPSTPNYQWNSELLYRHPATPITAVAASRDGQRLAIAQPDGTVHLWTRKTGRVFHVLTGHVGAVRSLAISRDGQFLVSGGDDALIRLWHWRSGSLVRMLHGHKGPVRSLALSGDRSILVSTSDDGTVRHWHLATGQPMAVNNSHNAPVFAVVLQGLMVLSATQTGRLLVSQLKTGETLHTDWDDEAQQHHVRAIALHPNGRQFATASSDAHIQQWSIAATDPTQRWNAHADQVTAIAYSMDGTLLVSGSADTHLKLWDAATGAHRGTLTGHRDTITHLIIQEPEANALRDGTQHLISSSLDGYLHQWTLNPVG
ncbi:MAG: DnaJ domain-containing protein [Kaiparowitsia implicata GSE-PSE-MK54-09C]|jgi:tetratricopeptide (TPR) repeat protein|nr:DnaJ domain-containing protein [Kaiparowitsia implicata GSE-PSE-MK54-09C]